MAFAPDVVEKLLVACHRHCCLCHKPAGMKMEIHHIVPRLKGKDDGEDNGIPLCFDCHAEVAAYDPKHPKGRRFTPSELRKHKEQWFAICAQPPWFKSAAVVPEKVPQIADIDDKIFQRLRQDDPRPAQALVGAVAQLEKPAREAFAARVFDGLQADDEDTRWNFAMVVQELFLWEPSLVPLDILEGMSKDSCFFVRSSAAVCYYYLARLAPVSVPLDVLSRLAGYDEDWYVHTPAVNALLRLAGARPVVADIFARNLSHDDSYAREHSASAIGRLTEREPDLVPFDLLEAMVQSKDPFVREIGQKSLERKKKAEKEPGRDYPLF